MKLTKILKTFGFDLGFFILLAGIAMFLREKIRYYLSVLSTYGSLLNSVNPEQDVVKAQQLLQELSGIADRAVLILLVLVPIAIFLIYCLLQGGSFYFLHKKKNYLLWFSIASLPAYLFLLLMLNYLWLGLLSWIILLVLSFFGFVYYLKPEKKGFLKLIKKWLIFITFFYLQTLIYEYSYWSLLLALFVIFLFSYYKTWLVEKFS